MTVEASKDWADIFAGQAAESDGEIEMMICGCSCPISAFTPVLDLGPPVRVKSLVCIQCKTVWKLNDGELDMGRMAA